MTHFHGNGSWHFKPDIPNFPDQISVTITRIFNAVMAKHSHNDVR